MKTSTSVLLALALLGMAPAARAEIQDDTASLGAGRFSLAAEFQAERMAAFSSFMFNLHQRVGVVGGLDVWLREGLPVDGNPHTFYLGGGIKWTILGDHEHGAGLALWAGGHYWTGVGLAGANVALLVDHRFARLTPYGGLHYEIDFGGTEVLSLLRFLAGLRIHVVHHFAWFVEGGVGFFGTPLPLFIATGPRFDI